MVENAPAPSSSDSNNRGATTFKLRQDSLSKRKAEAIASTKRKMLVLGRHVKQTIHGVQIGGTAWYEPSPFSSELENTFVYGPSGSGKTYTAYALASQSLFFENRTWLIFDTKFSLPRDARIQIKINGKESTVGIGSFVDQFIPSTSITSSSKRINKIVEVPSIDKNGAISWQHVVAVSKHKSPNCMIHVTMVDGRSIIATEGHSFLVRRNLMYESVRGSNLKVNDELPSIDPGSSDMAIPVSIVAIGMLEPESDFVYDLQVQTNENFTLENGLIVHNSYQGNWRPNYAFAEDLAEFGLYPRGIPGNQIDIIAPEYYMQYISPDEIRRTRVTTSYRIPLAMCRLAIMFELTKLKKGAGYAATFEVLFQNLLKETNYKPTLDQFKKMTEDMMQDDKFPSNMVWVFNMMLDRIDRIAKFTIDDKHQWSPVGEALFKAAREGKPRWIVFTLAHAQSPTDAANLAMLTAVLDEVKAFAKKSKVEGFNIPLGVFIDELHTFVNDPQSTSVKAVHDLMHAWGRSSKVWRIYATQKQEQLPKTFRDSVDNMTNAGTYQNIISCQQVPEPGYGKFLDRLHGRSDDGPVSNSPRFYPSVKFCPPMIEVESDYIDEDTWRRSMIEKFSDKKKQNHSPVSNEPWEDIVANLESANTKMRSIIKGNLPRVGGTILRGNPGTIPEIKGMWKDVADKLGTTTAQPQRRPRKNAARP